MMTKRILATVILALATPPALAADTHLSVIDFIPGIVTNGNSGIRGIGLSPDGTTLYAAYWTDSGSDSIGVYSTTNSFWPYGMNYGRCHGDVVVSANGRYAFAPTYYQGNVSRFDMNNGGARSGLSAGSWPYSIALSPDGTKLVAGSGQDGGGGGNDALKVYDVAGDNFALLGTIGLGYEVTGNKFAFSGDSQHVYVPTYRTGSHISRLYEASISGTYGVAGYLDFASDYISSVTSHGGTLFVSDATNSKIWLVDEGTMTVTDHIDLQGRPRTVAMHPDGVHLFVLSSEDTHVWVYDATTKQLVDSLGGPALHATPFDIEFSPDGGLAYVGHFDALGGISVLEVPEPGSLSLLMLGGLALLARRRRGRGAAGG